jgi:hypothetical protein
VSRVTAITTVRFCSITSPGRRSWQNYSGLFHPERMAYVNARMKSNLGYMPQRAFTRRNLRIRQLFKFIFKPQIT